MPTATFIAVFSVNIACYSHYFVPEIGAPSARIYDLARQWLSLGHQVQVVTCFPNHPTGRLYPGYKRKLYLQEKMDEICVHRHWTYVTPNTGFMKKTLGHMSFLPSALLLSNRHISAADIAIGTSPTFFAAMAAAKLAASRRIPFVMEVRDLWPAIIIELGVLRNPHLIKLLEKWELALYRAATRVITVTETFRQNLIQRGTPPAKVFTIPNGADVEFWKPTEPPANLREQLGLQGGFVVLYIGAHGISHALETILHSAQLLQSHSDIHFLFVGEGAEKPNLIKKVKEIGLDNVRFLDPVDKSQVNQFYALADICLVPLRNISLFEAFIPSKMFEALAMGRPIVASVGGESADILQRSGGAVVVEPEDSRAIAECILELYRNPQRRRAMGERGRQFVVDHYSRRSLAVTYADILTEAVAESRCRSR